MLWLKHISISKSQSLIRFVGGCIFVGVLSISSCTKDIDIEIPEEAEQVVVEGSIENGRPPVVLLTKSAKFFNNININDLGSYFVRGAEVTITGSDNTSVVLEEFCLQDLNLSAEQQQLVLDAFGFGSVDSSQIPDICVYTVPDIIDYYLTGSSLFLGKENTTYNLDIMAPGFKESTDSVHVTSSTRIPIALGIDSLAIREHTNPNYRDSMTAIYAYVTVPDTFGNFLRYWTKTNSQPFYKPPTSSVYDDKLWVGLTVGLPLERGQSPEEDFDINTDTYFWRGDTITVKWCNIDAKTYDFFFTLEADGGDSPFSSPVKIKSNISNGLGIWAGYAAKYYTIIVPYQ